MSENEAIRWIESWVAGGALRYGQMELRNGMWHVGIGDRGTGGDRTNSNPNLTHALCDLRVECEAARVPATEKP